MVLELYHAVSVQSEVDHMGTGMVHSFPLWMFNKGNTNKQTKKLDREMSLKIITNFNVLMQKARTLGQARLSKDPEKIAKAEADHDAYRDLCLRSDEMSLDCTYGNLCGRKS